MTALNEWTAELKKNEAHAWRRTRAERKGCAVRQAFSHFDSTAMRVHTAETLSGSRVTGCAVKRRWSTAGYTRPGTGSLHPVAIRAAVEATRLLKPLVQRVARRLGERAGRNVSKR